MARAGKQQISYARCFMRLVLFALVAASTSAVASPGHRNPKAEVPARAVDLRRWDDLPRNLSVSEVSADGHAHNRLTFDCDPGEEATTIDCVVVQQTLRKPETISPEKMTDKDQQDFCKDVTSHPAPKGDIAEARFAQKMMKACAANDRMAIIETFKEAYQKESQTCRLWSIVRKETFRRVDKNTWRREPDPYPTCVNITIKGTLRRDPDKASSWSYTEVVVATPSKKYPSLCDAQSETTRFTTDNANTASELPCRFIEM